MHQNIAVLDEKSLPIGLLINVASFAIDINRATANTTLTTESRTDRIEEYLAYWFTGIWEEEESEVQHFLEE